MLKLPSRRHGGEPRYVLLLPWLASHAAAGASQLLHTDTTTRHISGIGHGKTMALSQGTPVAQQQLTLEGGMSASNWLTTQSHTLYRLTMMPLHKYESGAALEIALHQLSQ